MALPLRSWRSPSRAATTSIPDEVKTAFEQLSDEQLDAVLYGGTAKLMVACAKGVHYKEATITH